MKFRQLLGAAALLAPAARAQTVGDDVCDAACQQAFQGALAQESALWASADATQDPFYSTPANASGAQPGDLLRWQEVPADMLDANWTQIPAGFSFTRLLYMSEDIDRKPIPASAFVLLPYSLETEKPGNATAGCKGPHAFQTVAWTHGTAGYGRQCAPSNHQQLYYGWGGPFFYAAMGYAVVAPDYAGQGSDIPGGFQYEAGYLHAADVAYALVAARKMLGNILSEDYVVVGHSEGGMTAWRTNQRLAEPDQDALLAAGNFLGSVAIAPALRPRDLIPRSIEIAGDGPLGDPVSIFFLQSLENQYPELAVKDILSDRVQALLPLASQGCLATGGALFHNLSVRDTYKSTDWLQSPQLADWQERFNGDKNGALKAPMLVVQGLGDMLTYANNTRESFEKLCATHQDARAELYQIPGLGHGGALDSSHGYIMPWIAARFAGQDAPQSCEVKTAKPLNNRYQTDRPH